MAAWWVCEPTDPNPARRDAVTESADGLWERESESGLTLIQMATSDSAGVCNWFWPRDHHPNHKRNLGIHDYCVGWIYHKPTWYNSGGCSYVFKDFLLPVKSSNIIWKEAQHFCRINPHMNACINYLQKYFYPAWTKQDTPIILTT